jgi:hypothetical protein
MPNSKKAQNTPIISILSAIGSSSLPKSEVKFFLLAKKPSKKSVSEASKKTKKAKTKEIKLSFIIRPMQIKAKKMRKRVSLFEIFMYFYPCLLVLGYRDYLSKY